MAEDKMLLLVAMEEGNEVNIKAVDQVKRQFGQGKTLSIASTLMENYLSFASSLRDLWLCPFLPSSDWDPVSPCQSDSESSNWSDSYTLIESSSAGNPDYVKKLENAIFLPGNELKVVVTTPGVVSSILQLLSFPNESLIALLSLDCYHHSGSLLLSFKSPSEAIDHLISVSLHSSHHSLCMQPSISFEANIDDWMDWDSLDVRKYEGKPREIQEIRKGKTDKYANKDIKRDLGELLRKVKVEKRENTEEENLETEKVITEAREGLDPQLLAYISSINDHLQSLEASKSSLPLQLRSISSQIATVAAAQQSSRIHLTSLTSALHSTLSHLDSSLKTSLSSVETARNKLKTMVDEKELEGVRWDFDLRSVTTRGDMMLVASVYCRKQYAIPCILEISPSSGPPFSKPQLISSSLDPIEVGYVYEFPDNDYQLTLVSETTRKPVSNTISVVLREGNTHEGLKMTAEISLEDSVVYSSVGNIEEIEHSIREKAGNRGVEAFQTLVKRWSNGEEGRVNEFVEVCVSMAEMAGEDLEKELKDKGFTFY